MTRPPSGLVAVSEVFSPPSLGTRTRTGAPDFATGGLRGFFASRGLF